MSTGSIQDAAVVVMTDLRHDALQLSFVNDSGALLTPGQEVTLKTDGTIDKRDAGTEVPLGIVVVGGDDGKRVTVRTYFTAVIKAKAIGGAINAGVLVKPNGLKDATTGVPEYVAGTSSDYAVGMVIKGAAENGQMIVGILDGIVAGNDHAYASQELDAYVADDESAAYTGADAAALLIELNALRVAYENLRAAHEDLRAKLVTPGIVSEA